MRLLKILGLSSLLGLVGCFDSTASVGSSSSPGFVLSHRYLFDAKIVLRSAEGRWGPMFLMTHGLSIRDSSGDRYRIGGLFPYGVVETNTPWIDMDLWVDYQAGMPRLDFWDLRSPYQAAARGTTNWIDLDQCADLPKSVFQTAKATGQNPVEHHPLLRVGRFVFATAQNPGFGVMSVSRPGIALVRMGDIATRVGDCSRFEESDAALAAKWIDLPPYKFDPGDTTRISGRITSVVEADFGVYVSYWLQGAPETPNSYRYYLTSIDTSGNARILDSSLAKPFNSLFRAGRRILAIRERQDLFELNTAASAPPQPLQRTWKGLAHPPCRDIEGRCVLATADHLYLMDSSTFDLQELDTKGLETNQITGVVHDQDTVYVSTLSGVFTKPLARFFEPVK